MPNVFRTTAIASTLPLLACAASGKSSFQSESTSSPGSAPGTATGGGTFNVSGSSSVLGTGPTGIGGTSDAGHLTRCDDAGQCSCIAIASIGHEGVWGPCSSDSTTAFQNWLNTQSTARVDNYDTTKPTLTAAFLAQYDVIILQWMVANGEKYNDGAPWVFSADEISALQDWVKEGGGIIALNGYQCNDNGCTIADVTATNQLLSFTDIKFNSDDVLDPSNTTCQDCYCWGGSLPLGAPLATGGAPSAGAWDQTTPIGIHVSDVGAYVARSIDFTSAVADCADLPDAGTSHTYAVHEAVGMGHVVAYGDEWITYSGEWLGTGPCLGDGGIFGNMYDPCYQKSPTQAFQIAQLWYNAIKYAASSVQCFDIQSPYIVR
jgi:hypothetical protein